MEEKKIQLKKKTPTGVDILYPQVRLEDVEGLMGTGQYNNQYIKNSLLHITEADLPSSVFGGLKFSGVLSTQDSDDYSSPGYWEHSFDDGDLNKGTYFIISAPSGGYVELPPDNSRSYNVKIQYTTKDEDEGGSSGGNVELENGDWLIVNSLTGAPRGEATEENPSIINFAVVNNTYHDASDNATGVVKLIFDGWEDEQNWTQSSSAISGYALYNILDKRVDASPTSGSTKVVTSGGVYTALAGKLGTNANAASATKLATKRTIALSGGATGTTATGFDGSNNITISVTALDASKLTAGTVSFERLPKGEKGQKLIAGPTGTPSWTYAGVIYSGISESEFNSKAVSGDILITEV